jgi:hypothetical protein
MAVTFSNKLVVDGKEYESLDQVPAEFRGAIEKALASGTPSTTINVNGKTVASADDLPPLLRAIFRGVAEIAEKSASGDASALSDAASVSPPGAVRPEPLVGTKALVILIGLAALVFWLVRSAL